MKKTFLILSMLMLLGIGQSWAELPPNEYFLNRNPKKLWSYASEDGDILSKEFYKNGVVKSVGVYRDGKLEGTYREYSDKSVLVLEVDYVKGKPKGAYKEYFTNGNVKKKGFYSDGVLDGKLKVYFENGSLQMKLYYFEGKLDGESVVYFPNGDIREEANYVNGKLDGLFQAYYKSGALKTKINYKANNREGPFESYYENGNVMESGVFKDDVMIKSNKYSSQGTVLSQTNVVQGREMSAVNKYDENGVLRAKEIYVNGVFVEKKIYDENGDLVMAPEEKGVEETGAVKKNSFDFRKILIIGMIICIAIIIFSIFLNQFSSKPVTLKSVEGHRAKKEKPEKDSVVGDVAQDSEVKAKYSSFVDNLEEAVYVADHKGSIISANDSFAQRLGYSSEQAVIGLNINELFSDFGLNEYTFLVGFKESSEVSGYKFKCKAAGAQDIVLLASGSKVFDDSGECTGIKGSVTVVKS